MTAPIRVFSTCPQWSAVEKARYLRAVTDVAHWSDELGFEGILIYTDHSQLDPWLIAQVILQTTGSLCPLVAVQPAYMHPCAVAKMVATLGHLYGRRVYLNMVAGGFKNDLLALNDATPHDRRYDRVIEYVGIIKELLAGESPVSYDGEFYKVHRIKMTPPLPQDLFPGILMSGSSDAGLAAAERIGATAIQYPRPVEEYERDVAKRLENSGIRVGIITRPDADEAWRAASERFPEDRRGRITHHLAMKVSDSEWHKQLSEMGMRSSSDDNPYWLRPFLNYKTFCPYLVGSYDRVAGELARYMTAGARTFILDIPPSAEELEHTHEVFQLASKSVR